MTRLSDFLRYTLDKDPMKRVSLRQEVDALNLYLGIEKLRFGERLKLTFDIEDAAYQGLVPSLILIVTYPISSGRGVELASGGQSTGHADFINAWRQPVLERIVRRCREHESRARQEWDPLHRRIQPARTDAD